MAIDSHIRGSERSHNRRKKGAKANGIWNEMIDEEYDNENPEIIVHIELLMELL